MGEDFSPPVAHQPEVGGAAKAEINAAWRRASAEHPLQVLLAEDSLIVRQRLIALITGSACRFGWPRRPVGRSCGIV